MVRVANGVSPLSDRVESSAPDPSAGISASS
jgi:hypothetical protein